jgi:dephospho-CoA kinase
MVVVGLTGGIGSGKSTVSKLLAERGAVIIDADAIVHELQAPGAPLLDQIAERFGAGVIAPDGSLDRAKLAAVAFADEESVKALNAIVHPAVGAEMAKRIAAQADTDNVVILDIPLLNDRERYPVAAVIVVDTSVEVALGRLVGQRGMAQDDVRARIAKQISREERRALADFVLDNDGDPDALARQVDEVWDKLHQLAPTEPQAAS